MHIKSSLWRPNVAFPIFENFNLPEASPKDGYDIISNAEVLFDESSVLNVHGVTRMVGPDAIGVSLPNYFTFL